MSKSISDLSFRAVVLLFVLLTAIGLFAGHSYSMSVDEDVEYDILRSNIAEYASIFGLSLGGQVTPISQSIEKDHGISAFYLISPLCILANRISRHALLLVWHSWIFILFMAGVISVYSIC